ncbi:MAG: Uma2 family endonuclease [Leptospiraceae bacterium]|nr:Uma2 family endonuclease [Leptospiraceae bacterium]
MAVLEINSVKESLLRLSRDKYHQMIDLGIITEKSELLDGIVIQKMPKKPVHTYVVEQLFWFIYRTLLKSNYKIRKEEPLVLDNSEPEPDLAIVEADEYDYAYGHPNFASFVIEVALTTIELDRTKASIYAKGNIPEYWIINLLEKTIEVYTSPIGNQYSSKKVFTFQEEVSSLQFAELKVFLPEILHPNFLV